MLSVLAAPASVGGVTETELSVIEASKVNWCASRSCAESESGLWRESINRFGCYLIGATHRSRAGGQPIAGLAAFRVAPQDVGGAAVIEVAAAGRRIGRVHRSERE